MARRHLSSRNLEADCARALYRAVRATGAGSRQEIRAAARGFVRRHRRDHSYLAWALRSVRASSALAAALLGLAAEPAGARSTAFTEQTGAANPFNAVLSGGVGSPSPALSPFLCDLDRDGDLDLVVIGAAYSFAFRYFENTGSATSPAFVERTGAANPLDGHAASPPGFPSRQIPFVLADVESDGDLDLLVGKNDGTFGFLENTGNAKQPAFIERTSSANPFDGLDAGAYPSQPALGDLDGDGDLDLGSYQSYFENTGDATTPAFLARTGLENPLRTLTGGQFGDADGDGDLDIVGPGYHIGTSYNYHENTGTPTHPAFLSHFAYSPSNPLHGNGVLGSEATSLPALGDLDGDGDLDVAAGYYGRLLYFENRAGKMVFPPWAPFAGGFPGTADVGSDARPVLADLDGDGDLDLLAGAADGTFSYFAVPAPDRFGSTLTPRTGSANPMNGVDVGSSSAPAFADLDGDGDFDLVSGESGGSLLYFENTGSSESPAFVPRSGAANPLNDIDPGTFSAPTFGDIDRDGDLDLFVGVRSDVYGYSNGFFHYLNTGTAVDPAFVAYGSLRAGFPGAGIASTAVLGDVDLDGDLDLLAGVSNSAVLFENTRDVANPALRFRQRRGVSDPSYLGAPALGDLDRDGDLDVLAGYSSGVFLYFRNAVIQPIAVAVHPLVGPPDPFAGESGGVDETPALGDLDGDGDPDIVAGTSSGELRYYENTGGATIPLFTARTGAASPLHDPGPGVDSAPALADLDADGDLDLLVTISGAFRYYENTGSATDPACVLRTGSEDPLAGSGYYGGGNGALAFGDLDADGDFDLVVGYDDGQFNYFRNTGDATNPHFFVIFGNGNPLYTRDVGARSTPALADLDRDGDLDLVAGNADGTFVYFANASPTIPGFSPLTGLLNPLNPFDGIDVGQRSAPALGDLDAYGNEDLVAGSSGGFRAYLLPEPGRSWLFAAGAAVLALLARFTPGAGQARASAPPRTRSAR